MEKVLDNGGSFGVLSVDLSKAFGCIAHDHLLGKLSGMILIINHQNWLIASQVVENVGQK